MMRYALTPEEAGEMLGLSAASVRRAIKRGDIVAEKVGKRLLIPARALTVKFGEPVEIEVAA